MPTIHQSRTVTAEELFEISSDGGRFELVEGTLCMMSPAGGRHGRIAVQLAYLLKSHVDQNRLGVVFAAETGFKIQSNPDTVLAPDVAYVTRDRFESIKNELEYLPLAPDLVAEVLSPNDRFSRVEAKAFAWLDAGTKLVLVVDPESENVHVYWSKKRIEVFNNREIIDCGVAVADWSLVVSDIFRLFS
jgi:Uma2 family endonuclease